MSDSETRKQFARDVCLPYLMDLERFREHLDVLSFMLVGSVATGDSSETSDIDVAVVCDRNIYDSIAAGTDWDRGRPTEEQLDGVRLQYYGIAFEKVERKLRELDDAYLYVYGNALTLSDPDGQYFERLASLLTANPDVRRDRVEGKLDMLSRRSRALDQAIEAGDNMSVATVCLELLRRSLELIALMDRIEFDPRKRLFMTAMRGELGRKHEPLVRTLMSAIGELGDIHDAAGLSSSTFPERLEQLIASLSEEASRQGFRVGLDTPDLRQA